MRNNNTADVTIKYTKKSRKNKKDYASFVIRNRELCNFEYVNIYKNTDGTIVFMKSKCNQGNKLCVLNNNPSGNRYVHFQFEKARYFKDNAGDYAISSVEDDKIICKKLSEVESVSEESCNQKNITDTMEKMEKPPIGLEPRDIFEMRMRSYRRNEIVKAMRRYQEAKKQIPDEWLTELEELC